MSSSGGMNYADQEQPQVPNAQQPPQQQPPQALLPAPFAEDPCASLASVASQPPSRQGLSQLAGQVAKWISHQQLQQPEDAPPTAAAAAETLTQQPQPPNEATADGRTAAGVASSISMTIPPPSQISYVYLQAAAKQLMGDAKVGDMEQEMLRAQQQYEILEVSSIPCLFFSSL